jgi:hypothetical protein
MCVEVSDRSVALFVCIRHATHMHTVLRVTAVDILHSHHHDDLTLLFLLLQLNHAT